jgi:hypothetical protein
VETPQYFALFQCTSSRLPVAAFLTKHTITHSRQTFVSFWRHTVPVCLGTWPLLHTSHLIKHTSTSKNTYCYLVSPPPNTIITSFSFKSTLLATVSLLLLVRFQASPSNPASKTHTINPKYTPYKLDDRFPGSVCKTVLPCYLLLQHLCSKTKKWKPSQVIIIHRDRGFCVRYTHKHKQTKT